MRQVAESGWEESGRISAMQSALARCDWSRPAPLRLRRWLGAQLVIEPEEEEAETGAPEDWDL